jgi:hypothetical protein
LKDNIREKYRKEERIESGNKNYKVLYEKYIP